MTSNWHSRVIVGEAVKRLGSGAGRAPMFTALAMPDDEASEADERYHDAESDRYDRYSEIPRISVAERWILPWIRRNTPNGIVVDLGCGTGRIARFLAGSDRRVIAIDRSRRMLDKAGATLDGATTTLLRCDAREIPIRDASVDSVVCSGVLHHIPDLPAAMQEIARLLRPGGTLIVREPNAQYSDTVFAPVEKAMAGLVAASTRYHPPIVASAADKFMPSPVERPIALAEISAEAVRCGLRLSWAGSAKFFGSLGIPEAVPFQRVYFEVANVVDRAILHTVGLDRGALAMAVYLKGFD